MVTARFLFHDTLNDFLPRPRRGSEFSASCASGATTKHMIEAFGVPHTEVDVILVNGHGVGLEQALCDGDQVEVFPPRCGGAVESLPRVREWPGSITRFVADAQLGGLARLLRMAGFDTLYRNDYPDRQIAELAAVEQRVVLTRDRDLLKHRVITYGCYVRAINPGQQLREIVGRLGLAAAVRPFTRCLRCNVELDVVAAALVRDRLPPSVRDAQSAFTICRSCGRIFWPGSHWRRMRALLDEVLPPGGGPAAAN